MSGARSERLTATQRVVCLLSSSSRSRIIAREAVGETARLHPEELGGVLLDQVLVGEGHLLELLGVRGGDLGASDTDGRGVQVVEGVLGGQGNELGSNAEGREAGLDSHHGAGLLDRVDDGLDVERLDGAEVDDLGLDAVLLFQTLGGDERLTDAAGEGDDGEILARALDLGLTEL